MTDSLRGQLLIASPALPDPFARTVVLVVEHGAEGAIGVVLNRPSEHRVAEVVPPLAALADADDLVYAGGPVGANAIVALGEFADRTDAASLLVGDLGLLDPDAESPSLRRLRVYSGYAGWAPAQLESELEREGWILEPAHPDDPFREDDLWAAALTRKGGSYALVARMPPDPSLN
ncbi:MAG: YqgE/AlgH family protein [Actinomycetota bacterium]|nr:YqgE/AlgH family protein [Actinomycetota bacterium]